MDLNASIISRQHYSKQPLILAVEDNEDNLLIIEYIVDSLNFRFIGELNGDKVLQIAQNYQPELILMDIMLPGVNGIDIFRQLKQDPLTSSIPVIAVTALAMMEDRKNIENTGFDGCIIKPYFLEDLESVILHHLQNFNIRA
ncbi:MAG: response regulator [Cyanobacteria bacterium P01_A01_bin.84]